MLPLKPSDGHRVLVALPSQLLRLAHLFFQGGKLQLGVCDAPKGGGFSSSGVVECLAQLGAALCFLGKQGSGTLLPTQRARLLSNRARQSLPS